MGLFLHQPGIDTSTAAGNAFFQMLEVFAEFERAIIVERVNAGIARQGKWHEIGRADRAPRAKAQEAGRCPTGARRRSEHPSRGTGSWHQRRDGGGAEEGNGGLIRLADFTGGWGV